MRINYTTLLTLTCVILLSTSENAKADYITTVSLRIDGGSQQITDTLSVEVWLHQGGIWPRSAAIFDDVLLTQADVGNIYFATSLSDPGFDNVVAWLTNGTADVFNVAISGPLGGLGNGGWEHALFENVTLNGVDLAGYGIEAISMRVDSLWINSPGTNPNGDGIWTDFGGYFTFAFIPEPATLLLLVLGGLVVRKRR